MALTYESLPPQIQQMLMQRFGVKTPADAQMLMQRLASDPEELAQVLQSLGIEASPEDAAELTQQAQDWIDNAATKAVDEGADTPPKPPEDGEEEQAPPEQVEPSEGDEPPQQAPDQDDADTDEAQSDEDEAEEGEGSPPQAAAQGASGASDMQATRASAATAGQVQDLLSAATGSRGVPSVRGGVVRPQQDMDAAITELISRGRQEGGASPQSRNFQAPRPKMPHSPAATASNDPRMRKMIADIYRTTANQSSGAERKYAPTGDRS